MYLDFKGETLLFFCLGQFAVKYMLDFTELVSCRRKRCHFKLLIWARQMCSHYHKRESCSSDAGNQRRNLFAASPSTQKDLLGKNRLRKKLPRMYRNIHLISSVRVHLPRKGEEEEWKIWGVERMDDKVVVISVTCNRWIHFSLKNNENGV